MRNRLPALLVAVFCGACQSPSAPSLTSPDPTPLPSPSPPSPSPPSTPASARFYVSGTVMDEDGSPLAGARVGVEYNPADTVFSIPPSRCSQVGGGCWVETTTDAGGQYDIVYDAKRFWRETGIAGTITASVAGHEENFQSVPFDRPKHVQNLRLMRIRTIGVGSGTTVTIDPDSSLCTSDDSTVYFDYRCETVTVSVGAPGTLVVEARGQGSSVPTVFLRTGNYGVPTRTGPGAISVPVGAGSFGIQVGTPVGMPSQRVDVSTALR